MSQRNKKQQIYRDGAERAAASSSQESAVVGTEAEIPFVARASAPIGVGIEVTVPPRTCYREGETFDASGMVISEIHMNGKRRQLQSEEVHVMPARPLLLTDTFVAISYMGYMTAIPIAVEASANNDSIELAAEPKAEDWFSPFYPSTVGLRFT